MRVFLENQINKDVCHMSKLHEKGKTALKIIGLLGMIAVMISPLPLFYSEHPFFLYSVVANFMIVLFVVLRSTGTSF